MANTGLLGVNPYQKGVNIDFSSKPVAVAMQLAQKDQARKEAVDKYFQDWEKSINPAGLAKGELDQFTQKLREIQDYGMKNRDAINDTRKYGYDAQSTLMSKFKDLQSYVAGAKQATAERLAFKNTVDKSIANGKQVSDNYLDVWSNAMKPYGNGYVSPSLADIQFFDPHNETKYTTNVLSNVKPAIIENEVPILDAKGENTGFSKKIKNLVLDNEEAKKLANNSYAEYTSNLGTQKHINELFNDKKFVDQFNSRFGEVYKQIDPVTGQEVIPKIQTAEDLARAIGLSKLPKQHFASEGPATLNDIGKFKEWQKREKIRATNNDNSNSQLYKSLLLASQQSNLKNTLDDYRTKIPFPDNPELMQINVTPDLVKDWGQKETLYPGLMNSIEKKNPKDFIKIPVIGEAADGKIFAAYPILDENGKETGKYDWKNKINVTNPFQAKLVPKGNANVPLIIGAGNKITKGNPR